MSKLRIRRPAPALVVASLALLVALGGTGYATVMQVPRNSVGTLQLQRNAVKASKIAPNAVRAAHVLNGSLLADDFKAGQLPKGEKGDTGARGPKGDSGEPGATNVVVRQGEPYTSPGGAFLGRVADCQPGERAVGGGGGLTSGGGTSAVTAISSTPRPLTPGSAPTGWQVYFLITAANQTVAAYVVCARP